MKKLLLLLIALAATARAESWPGPTPVLAQQSDGIIALPVESAAFLMSDRQGFHVMNTSSPALKIVDGKITNLGDGAQYPAWRFRVDQPGKYAVYLLSDNAKTEDCDVRVSFYEGKREFRVVAPVRRGSPESVLLGEATFGAGEFDAMLSLNGFSTRSRLPQIREVRLVPVPDSGSAKIFDNPKVRAALANHEAVRDAERAFRIANTELDRAKRTWNAKEEFSKFTSYNQIMQWDRSSEVMANGAVRVAAANEALRQARLKALGEISGQLPDEERAAVAAWQREQEELAAKLARDYPKTAFPLAAEPGGQSLFPTGGLEKMTNSFNLSGAKVFAFDAPAPPDEAERRAAFAARNSPEGLAQLARRLQAALRPDVAGLEDFYKAMAAEKYEEALLAYRSYFFAKLKSPEKFGAEGLAFVDDFFQQNGKAGVIRPPVEDWVTKNMEGIAVYGENGRLVEGRVGTPGAVDWAPADLRVPDGVVFGRGPDGNAFWKTPPGAELAQKIGFYRALNRLPTMNLSTAMFPDLLFSYLFHGNKPHLERLAEYLDDWCMNSVRDIDNCPVNIRAATELQVIGWFRAVLRVVLDERPAFATDLPAPTLARLMMQMTETFHPFVARAKRAELANWGIMGVEAALQDSLHFNEFRSMDYMNREMTRLARINWIHHLSLDGEGLEAWDEGHMAIDLLLSETPSLSRQGAPVMGDLEVQAFDDQVKTAQRGIMTHISPDGNYWVPWLSEDDSSRATIRGKIIPRDLIDRVFEEPEVRSRFSAILGKTGPKETPPVSDIQPYAALAYLRDGFGKDRTALLMQNFPVRSQAQGMSYNGRRGHLNGYIRMQYGVSRDGKGLLEAGPILVDSRPPNIFTDLTPSGGKTDYSFQTPRNVQPGRFLASEEFDVVESHQDSPYSRYKFAYGTELFGLNSPEPDVPIRDVRATREIVYLRSEGIFVIGDRVENKGPQREFAKMFIVPVRVPAPGEVDRLRLLAEKDAPLLELDRAANRVRSFSPGLPNVSLYLAGHDFTWGGRSTGAMAYAPAESVSAKALYDQVKAAKDPNRVLSDSRVKTLSVRWRGEGNQALAAVVLARAAEADPEKVDATELSDFREMNGPGGIAGFSFRSPMGAEVWYQIAPTVPADLAAGPVKAAAGSLLATRRDGRISGVAMQAAAVTIDGKTFPGPADAFTFVLEKDGKFSAVPVRAPIDTVAIEPAQTVFSDTLKVSFSIPTQKRDDVEFRYTLDGSDPTLASALYTGPFEISADTLVKVRPFLKGLSETPWNIAGSEAGKTVSAIYRKTPALPAVAAENVQPGLNFTYFEDSWPVLMSHSGMYPLLPVKASGAAQALLDTAELAAMRQTDRAYAVKYDGFLDVPETGVYRFFAPEPLYNTTKDAGYDLRVWIDGKEWFPNPELHAENVWSVALEKGLHHFQVSYVDYRWKTFRDEYWMSWNPKQMWEGTPVLEVDGPGLSRQPVPAAWLKRKAPGQ
ncbi:MAG TPA: FN3 associated domain-containing protein [Terrimicrobiaceae bacterium]|nr:FN3 associated domain-containing protein [Terrimicrobiaceae bacterium]